MLKIHLPISIKGKLQPEGNCSAKGSAKIKSARHLGDAVETLVLIFPFVAAKDGAKAFSNALDLMWWTASKANLTDLFLLYFIMNSSYSRDSCGSRQSSRLTMANGNHEPELPRYSWDPKRALLIIGGCIAGGLAVVLLQATQMKQFDTGIGQVTTMLAVSGAATMLGGLIGFLFGIPRRLQVGSDVKPGGAAEAGTDQHEQQLYEGNTNLEQISDWLTKIIVGVTLVKLSDIVAELSKYGEGVAAATGRPSDAAFAVGLMIFFFIAGFLAGYLWSRLYLGRALTEAESRVRLQRKLDKLEQQAQSDGEAIAFARRQISSGGEPVPAAAADAILAAASAETLAHIFSMAENNRWRNWQSNKEQMERSIPIFEALVRLDPLGRYHRNLGQLAYCLKDKRQPDWDVAETLFTRGIECRGEMATNGWGAYEANRAITRIALGERFSARFGSPDDANEAIESDLRTALQDYWVAHWLKKEPIVEKWANENQRGSLLDQ